MFRYLPYTLLLTLFLFPFVSVNAKTGDTTNDNDIDIEVQRIAQKMVHMLDYVAVEYPEIVVNGKVTDVEEYKEQQEFAEQLQLMANRLPANSTSIKQETAQLFRSIEQKGSSEEIVALSHNISLKLINKFHVGVAPRVIPEPGSAKTLFIENCSTCHGADGYGDGPQAATLQPPPANFRDRERQQHRSVFSLYNTISLGVNGTAMPSFDNLTSQQRWQLAFYVSNFFATDIERAKGEAIYTATKSRPSIKSLEQLTQSTPAQVTAKYGSDGLAELAYLRSNPEEIGKATINPLKVAEDGIQASFLAFQKGDHSSAYDLAVAAYLEGFELVETPLDSAAPELRKEIEIAMLKYRDMVKTDTDPDEVQAAQENIITMLSAAAIKLDNGSLSSSLNFFSAFLILLREGLEAILILAAISAVLIKTGRSNMMRYLHIGWVSALALGGLTWFAADHFINISGANREMTEGITALIAAAMLIYVGFWLHKQTYALHWQHFIKTKVSQSLTESALAGLAVVAFLAVYREVFESILFFHTLWLQSNIEGQADIVSGMLTAAGILGLIAWGIFKFSIRLPLKLFFRVNSVFLYLLAIVFAGKGVAALQEAGKLRVDPINFFEIDALGIFPNLESLGIQATMIAAAVLLYIVSRNKIKREEAKAA
ncbi:FTR1 family protein [Kaarinaea lacus]